MGALVEKQMTHMRTVAHWRLLWQPAMVQLLRRQPNGCFMLVRDDTADGDVPVECESAYQEECGEESLTLYNKDCRTLYPNTESD
ncbi:hypothetical protein HPB50_020737 [Hyalomma asiaticum]|uniref:Uncharacterized protein n=1 Tax=Hyalomma asiaticum TaxID=266040 RepID=A0ACB7RPM3_HYAAI|nr:hypothetical protein HPB50_020737 [Hyalomma asiaticum]